MMFHLHKLRRRVGAKLRSHKGLSLLELLLTTVILLLITQLMADGLPVVIRLYRRTVDTANAQAYLSTTMIALRSKLSVASEVKIDDSKTVYLDPETGYYYKIKSTNEGIKIEYLNAEGNSFTPEKSLFLLQAVKEAQNETNTLISAYDDDITLTGNTFTIKGLRVVSRDDNSTLAKLNGNFIIHTVNQ